MFIDKYYETWWNTGSFISEFVGGFFVVLFLIIPMFFTPIFKFKSDKTTLFVTLSFQSFGVTFGILIGKLIGDLLLVSSSADSQTYTNNQALGIGNASGIFILAFETMNFKGLPYILFASVGGGICGAIIAFLICYSYNCHLSKEMKQDLRLIFCNPTKKQSLLLTNEFAFQTIWLFGVVGIIGLAHSDIILRELTISLLAIPLLIFSASFGFFILAFNFNVAKWLVGGIFLKNFTKTGSIQLLESLSINIALGILVGSILNASINFQK